MKEKLEKNGLHVFRISKQYSLNKVDLHGKSSEGKELVGKRHTGLGPFSSLPKFPIHSIDFDNCSGGGRKREIWQ